MSLVSATPIFVNSQLTIITMPTDQPLISPSSFNLVSADPPIQVPPSAGEEYSPVSLIQNPCSLQQYSSLFDMTEIYRTNPQNPLTEVEKRALATYAHIPDNIYQNSKLGLADDAEDFVCSCTYRHEHDEKSKACGDDDTCINRLMFMECRPDACPVGAYCLNRRFQIKDYAPVEVFDAGLKGFGLRCTRDLSRNTFIMEYVGDVITRNRFLRRAHQYAAEGCQHFYFMALRSDQIIDAQKRGGLARFINHSCRPNSCTQKWVVSGKLRIGLFTTRSIQKGDEITFDYKFERYGSKAQPCYCGESCCTGFIGGMSKNERAALEIGTITSESPLLPPLLDNSDEDDGMEGLEQAVGTARCVKPRRLQVKEKRKRKPVHIPPVPITEESSLRRLIGPWLLDVSSLSRLERDIGRLLITDSALLKTMVLIPKVGFALLAMLKTAVHVPDHPPDISLKNALTEETLLPVPSLDDVGESPLSTVPYALTSDKVPPWRLQLPSQTDGQPCNTDPPTPAADASSTLTDTLPSNELLPHLLNEHESTQADESRPDNNLTEPHLLPLPIKTLYKTSQPQPASSTLNDHQPTKVVGYQKQYSVDHDQLIVCRNVLTFYKQLPITKRNTVSKPGLLNFVQKLSTDHPDETVLQLANVLVTSWMGLEEVWEIPKLISSVPIVSSNDTSSSTCSDDRKNPMPESSSCSKSSPPPPTPLSNNYRLRAPDRGSSTPTSSYITSAPYTRREPMSHGWRAYTLPNPSGPDVEYYYHPVTMESRWTLSHGMTSTPVSQLKIVPHIPPSPPSWPHPVFPHIQNIKLNEVTSHKPAAAVPVPVNDVVQQALREAERRVEEENLRAKMAIELEKQDDKRRRVGVRHFSQVSKKLKLSGDISTIEKSPKSSYTSPSTSDPTSSNVHSLSTGIKAQMRLSPNTASPLCQVNSSSSGTKLVYQHPDWFRAAVKALVVQQLNKHRPKHTSVSPSSASCTLAHPLGHKDAVREVAREISIEILTRQRALSDEVSRSKVIPTDMQAKMKEFVLSKVEVLMHRYKKNSKLRSAAETVARSDPL